MYHVSCIMYSCIHVLCSMHYAENTEYNTQYTIYKIQNTKYKKPLCKRWLFVKHEACYIQDMSMEKNKIKKIIPLLILLVSFVLLGLFFASQEIASFESEKLAKEKAQALQSQSLSLIHISEPTRPY